ncbi:MAG: Kdo hydroxylase family protein [Isosphaeraceae bacterium]|nr:Kdo hydroxylase family protein [Isosphaeraceae bacterium]
MARIAIEGDPRTMTATEEQYRALESGDILYFPATPFELTAEERAFLVTQKQIDASYYKNISYRPAQDRLKGVDQKDPALWRKMHATMRAYSQRAIAFMAQFLPRYARDWKIDFASFRPIEEAGRKVALRSRNDLIHVDNFPSRPSHGDRLLRIFTNIHPERPRIWITSDSFARLAEDYARQAGLPLPPTALSRLQSLALRTLSGIGLPVVDRPAYDQFMLKFHHFLKENETFQRDCRKDRWEFPSGSSWIVFTDTSSHACLSGQYALEQTFIVRRGSLTCPELAPIAILERMVGFPLAVERRRSA